MSKIKKLSVSSDFDAHTVKCEAFVSSSGMVSIDISGNFKLFRNNPIPSYTEEEIESNLSGVELWISEDGTFFKDETFEFKNSMDIEGDCTCNSVVLTSDRKLKTNIYNIKKTDIEKMIKLQPVSFQWKKNIKENKNKNKDKLLYGFIAQDVQNIFPDMVQEQSDFLHMDYIQIIPLLLGKIKNMNTIQNNQENKINMLENKLNKMSS